MLNRRFSQRIAHVVVFTAISAILLCGCGYDDDQTAAVPQTLNNAVADLLGRPTELSQAKEMLTIQCARERGFNMPQTLTVNTGAEGYADVRGVFRSRSEAESVGYPSVTVNYDGGSDVLNAYQDTLNSEESERFDNEVQGVLDNPETNSDCWFQATRWIYGSWSNYTDWSHVSDEYGRSKSDTTLNDPDVVAAIRDEYMPCMAEYGYNVRGLRAYEIAQKEFGAYRMYNEPPDEREKTLARHDFDCQERAGLMDKLDAAMQRTAGKWMLENEAMLLERHELLEQAMGRAKQVIDGSVTYQTISQQAQ